MDGLIVVFTIILQKIIFPEKLFILNTASWNFVMVGDMIPTYCSAVIKMGVAKWLNLSMRQGIILFIFLFGVIYTL